MVFKKWHKPVKKAEVKPEVIEEETPVTTEVENVIIDDKEPEVSKSSKDVVGDVGWTSLHMQPRGIRFQKFDAPVPLCMIKDVELKRYLVNNWFGTNVYQKDKEWLEKHHADMKMIERLKKYVTGM